jgi:TatD DNase family protein
MIIDTHSHIYLEEFEKDIDSVITNAQSNGVSTIFMPAINSETHDNMIAIANRYALYCKAMIGLHPCYVKSDYENELKIVDDYLSHFQFSGIGECGLDF